MHMRFGPALVLLAGLVSTQVEAATCDGLMSLTSGTMTVTAVETIAAGVFPPPVLRGRPDEPELFKRLPAFCRVSMVLKPTPLSNIRAEVWMLPTGWNGKLQVVGNGAWAGRLGYTGMARALDSGYAAASTDTGHTGGAENTVVNKEVFTDFVHRSIHETTVAARKVVDVFYGAAPRFTYFNGCSTGGRQAVTAALKYPDDFDGIIAGAPALHGLNLAFGQIWIHQAMTKDPASLIPDEKLKLLQTAALAACDANDGARDGVLENPMACRFDPQVLACRQGADPGTCLTPAQVQAAQKIYAGAQNTRTGRQVFPGYEPGSETGWSQEPVGYAVDLFKYVVFKNARWNPHWLNFDGHYALTAESEFKLLDADDPDLTAFFKSGGKVLMYHGWNDAGIPPRGTVSYYQSVRSKIGPAADDSLRLFMVPGMGHCRGGDGTDRFDAAAALDSWVTSGKAPSTIPASRVRDGKVTRSRPLCAYPQIAVYKGSGSVDEAANFECRAF